MLHEELGPYRIDEKLGSGGMGDVYKAYDRRLDRWVAIKVIRPGTGETLKARERFRREARAAAGVSHSTIVQIHDIIEREDDDCIVMELVEGESLAELLDRGPLDLMRAIRIGREIAEGLAAAHARDLVHRDLKAENIMITADDRPKILDFGLAKRLHPDPREATLSIAGRVVGTGHAMSPEQAQGFGIDARSDLFSLGTLLYEMVTGVSPFRRPSLAETLTRVCVHQQVPAAQLRDEVPTELSKLTDRLLAKKPEDRPGSASEVAAELRALEGPVSAILNPSAQVTLVDMPRPSGMYSGTAAAGAATVGTPTAGAADPETRHPTVRNLLVGFVLLALAAVGAFWLWPRPVPPPPLLVAVPNPELEISGAGPRPELLAEGVRVTLLQALQDLEGVRVLTPEEVDRVAGEGAREILRRTGAGELLTSRVSCAGGLACLLTLHRVGAEGEVLASETTRVLSDDVLAAGRNLLRQLPKLYPEREMEEGGSFLEVREEDYEEYLRLRQALLRQSAGLDLAEIEEGLAEIIRSSPRFLPAYLEKASVARTRFVVSREERHLVRALDITEAARRQTHDPVPVLRSMVLVSLDGRLLDQAEKALDELQALEPHDPVAMALRAALLLEKGQTAEALDRMRDAVALLPSVSNFQRLAQMEISSGNLEAARQTLDELLNRAPEHFGGRFLRGHVELLGGEPERAVEVFQSLAAESTNVGVWSNLGLAQLLIGEYEAAAGSFRQARDQAPRRATIVMNLADALSLLGRKEEARQLYQETLELVGQDPSAKSWDTLSVQAQVQAHLGRREEAVALAQEVLRLAPDNPQAALEVALVYAVVEEESSALVNARRALELGVEPVWFRLPWFDPLREIESYRELLQDGSPAAPPPSW